MTRTIEHWIALRAEAARHDWTTADVAERLGVARGTVCSGFARAKKELERREEAKRSQSDEPAAVYADPKSLVPWKRNPRHNDDAVGPVAESIERLGFGAPILAREKDRVVIAGHTRLKAALSLGLAQVPVRFLDVSKSEAEALALADNRLGEIATWDEGALAGILRDLGDKAVGLGWSDADLAELLNTTPWLPPDGTPPDPNAGAQEFVIEIRGTPAARGEVERLVREIVEPFDGVFINVA